MSEQPTYSVSVYDHELDDWASDCRAIPKWEIRNVLRRLYGNGYDTETILVEIDEARERRRAVS